VIPVPLHHSSYPCKCDGKCDYSKANEDEGSPQYIGCEYYIKKDFEPMSKDE